MLYKFGLINITPTYYKIKFCVRVLLSIPLFQGTLSKIVAIMKTISYFFTYYSCKI